MTAFTTKKAQEHLSPRRTDTMDTMVDSPELSSSPSTTAQHNTSSSSADIAAQLHHLHEHIDTIALALTGTTGVEQHQPHEHEHTSQEHGLDYQHEKKHSISIPFSPTTFSTSTITATNSPTEEPAHDQQQKPSSFATTTATRRNGGLKSLLSSILESLKEGGAQGWLAVLGSMLIHCFVFAPTEFIFGIFELHYETIFPNSTPASIAFVGTTGSAITYIAGFLSGLVADRFGFRPTAFLGAVVMALSLVLASFSKQLWHLYICQGVLFGIGASLTYYPAIAVPSQYFVNNRGLAIGIAVSGTGLGGFILAPLTHALIDKVDLFWTLRILALMILVVCGGASMLIKEKKDNPRPVSALTAHNNNQQSEADDVEKAIHGHRQGRDDQQHQAQDQKTEEGQQRQQQQQQPTPSFFQSLHVFKNPQFLSLTMAELAASIGYLIPLYYMQTYAVYIGLTAEQGALILGLSNGSAFVGRILLGVIADRVSNTRTLLFCCWATAVSVMVFWTIAKSFGTLLLMGVTFNLFAGAYVSLVPVAVAESFGTQNIASMIGLMYAAGGIAIWGGSPLAGFILDSTLPNLSYTPVIMTAGGSMLLGAICVTSWAYFHWRATRLTAGRVTTQDTL